MPPTIKLIDIRFAKPFYGPRPSAVFFAKEWSNQEKTVAAVVVRGTKRLVCSQGFSMDSNIRLQ